MKRKKRKIHYSTSTVGYQNLLELALKIPSLKDLTGEMKNSHTEFIDSFYDEEFKKMLDLKDKSNVDVINNSNLSKDYFYAVYQGKRKPSRNKTIQLCFGLGLSGEEASLFLKKMGHNEFYLRNERDLVIFAALTKGETLLSTEEFLYDNGYETITKE
ncbi:hypothetical protein [Lysinibacillus sp. G01H]|uniref:hypothetical protein n=1 Tax=Lysinibacillus sp. G01H TaxID=3026425 RepID=UPI00237EBBDF|nr:hypothetical protein [Lysinibacillus sp. G01H]WDU78845.1 hypothetical protein PSR12_19705 [Lysinibacillus sp. G01H]